MGRHDIAIHLTAEEAIVVGEALTAHADYMQTVMALNPDWDRGGRPALRGPPGDRDQGGEAQGPVMLDVLEAATAHECVTANLKPAPAGRERGRRRSRRYP